MTRIETKPTVFKFTCDYIRNIHVISYVHEVLYLSYFADISAGDVLASNKTQANQDLLLITTEHFFIILTL